MAKIICYCKNVSEETIKEAINRGAKTLMDIQEMTGACTGNRCEELNPTGKCCSVEINSILSNTQLGEGLKCCCCS